METSIHLTQAKRGVADWSRNGHWSAPVSCKISTRWHLGLRIQVSSAD